MKRNGKSTNDPDGLLAGLVIPGLEFSDRDYASLKLRLDCYDDTILARKFKDGQGAGLYALDPLDVVTALAGLTLGTPLLPRNCLFWQRADGGERIAIYVEPRAWTVNVAWPGPNDDPKRKRGKRQTWRVPMPGLIWLGLGTGYQLWAVKAQEEFWPTPETALFKAPCPNVSENICRGDVPFPAASAATIWPALLLFFESDFNNHLVDGKSRKYEKNILEQWKALAEAGKAAWPEDDLVGAGTTLGKVMQ